MARVRSSKSSTDNKPSLDGGELSQTLNAIDKRYGIGVQRRASEIVQPSRISTGAFITDLALLGGIPDNRVTMIVGERHAGKSTIANKIVAAAQRKYSYHTPTIIDVEGTFDTVWAAKLGVDIGSLPIVQPDTGEMAVDIADALVGSQEVSLLVVDSLAALVPMKEIDDDAGDAHVGLHARLIGKMVRKVTASLIRERRRGHSVTVLFLNQFRTKVGVTHGDPRVIPGGKALEFCTSVQMIIKNKENHGKDDREVDAVDYNDHSFTINKNKLNNGPRTGEFRLVRRDGACGGLAEGAIADAHTMLTYAKKFGQYQGGGSRWTLTVDEEDYTFGKAQEAIDALYEDEELYAALRNQLLRTQAQHLGMPRNFIEQEFS